MIDHNHLEEDIGQDHEVVIEDQDHVIAGEDLDLDLDQEINHVIDQEAAHEEEADLE